MTTHMTTTRQGMNASGTIKTPLRAIRVKAELWQAAQIKAAAEHVSVSSIVIAALQTYVQT
jgi:hypothetical protein